MIQNNYFHKCSEIDNIKQATWSLIEQYCIFKKHSPDQMDKTASRIVFRYFGKRGKIYTRSQVVEVSQAMLAWS